MSYFWGGGSPDSDGFRGRLVDSGYNAAKGFGFIVCPELQKDFFMIHVGGGDLRRGKQKMVIFLEGKTPHQKKWDWG